MNRLTLTLKLNFLIYASLLVLCVVTATIIYLRAKKTPEFSSLTVFYICLILWIVLYVNELLSLNEARLYFNVRLTLVPSMFIGALFLIFALYYAGIITQENRIKLISLILLPQFLCVWPLFTSKYFHLVLKSKVFGANEDVWGALMFVSEVFTFLYIIAAVVFIERTLRRRGIKSFRMLAFAVDIPLFIQVWQFLFNPLKDLGIYLTLPSLALFFVVLTVYVLKYRLVEIIPVASQKIFSTMNEAVFIIDLNGKILDFNKAAGLYFEGIIPCRPYMSFRNVIDALNQYNEDKNKIAEIKNRIDGQKDETFEDTLTLYSPAMGSKQYTISISPLYSEEKRLIGKLAMFKDLTEYRTQTLLSERSRVSNDLHDSLGNSINIISSNLEYVINNFSDTKEVRESLQISHEKSVGAFVQLRRIVDELKPLDIEENGLLWALETLFYRLRVNGLHVGFLHNIPDDSQISKSKIGDAVYFICQEAISNSFAHGRAAQVTVTLREDDGLLKLSIIDDGVGCNDIEPKNGLNSIKRRVDLLGGKLNFGSPSCGGFNIKAELPVPVTSGVTGRKAARRRNND